MKLYRATVKVFIGQSDNTSFCEFYTFGQLIAFAKANAPLEIEDLKIGYSAKADAYWLYYERMETDEEYDTRIKPFKFKLEADEKRERAEYLRLKEKFEGELK